MAKNGKCDAGQYYCYTDKKCKDIPKGFMVDPKGCLLYTSPSPRDGATSRMPSSA